MKSEFVDDLTGFLGFVDFGVPPVTWSFHRSRHSLSLAHTSACQTVSLCGYLDLRNRADLAHTLGIGSSAPDGDLVIAAYRKWHDRCPEYLSGKFSFCLLDRSRHQVFCARDRLGAIPFFYRVDGTAFHFSGAIAGLLKSGLQPELNSDTLLRSQIRCGYWMKEGETFHKGLHTLPPACALTVHDRTTRVTQYWQLSVRRDLLPESDAAAFEAVRSAVESSVNQALEKSGVPGVLLSGGLDSSVITAVAARYLRSRNCPLVALTSVTEERPNRVPHEGAWASELVSLYGLDWHQVSANGGGPFDDLGLNDKFLGSPLVHAKRYMHRAMAARVAGLRIDTLLTGCFGEFSLSASAPQFGLRKILRGEWRLLRQYLDNASGSRKVSRLRVLAGELRAYLGNGRRETGMYHFTKAFLSSLPEEPFPYNSLLADNDALELTGILRVLNYFDTALCAPSEYPLGQRVDPFWDPHLLELCLGLPASLRSRDGYSRYLCRKPFEDILPGRIAWRRDKVAYSPDYTLRYAAQRGRALEYVRSIRPSDPVREIVDIPKLEQDLMVQDPMAVKKQRRFLVEVPNSIYLIHFLRQFPGFRV